MPPEKSTVFTRKKCPSNCPEHAFQIFPHNSAKAWIKTDMKIDFCPLNNDFTYQNIVPILNNDQQSYLPGFILEIDKIDYPNLIRRHQEEHDNKIHEYTMKKTLMFLPKPGRKHRYCGVCRRQYEEYQEHITSSDHIYNFNHQKFVGLITNIIIDTYGESNVKDGKRYSLQESSTQQKSVPILIEDDKPVKTPKKRGRPPKNPQQQMVIPPNPKVTKKRDTKKNFKQESLIRNVQNDFYWGLPFQQAMQPNQFNQFSQLKLLPAMYSQPFQAFQQLQQNNPQLANMLYFPPQFVPNFPSLGNNRITFSRALQPNRPEGIMLEEIQTNKKFDQEECI